MAVITEDRNSRTTTVQYGRVEERRYYKIRPSEPGESIRPDMLTSPARFGGFPYLSANSSGGSVTRRYIPKPGAPIPESTSTSIGGGRGEGEDGVTVRVDELNPSWITGHANGLQVEVIFRNIPDPEKPIVHWDGALVSEQTRYDQTLKQIFGPNGNPQTLSRQRPQRVARIIKRYVSIEQGDHPGPTIQELIDEVFGKTNETTWLGKEPGKWLCDAPTIDPVDDLHVDIEYKFIFDPIGWDPLGSELNQAGILLPAVLIPLYQKAEFRSLPGLETFG